MSEPIYDARTFWELVERRVADSPDRAFLIDPGGDETPERTVTFAEARAWAERTAAGFAAMGIGEGTPVTWVLPTRIETIVVSLALSRLGAVQNPIIHIYRDREVGFCIRQTAAEVVLTPGEWNGFDYRAMVERVTADLDSPPTVLDTYDTLPEGDPAELPPVPATLADGEPPIRWTYYTSGTTSDPKGVLHTDASLMAGGVGLARALDMQPTDVGSIAFPYAHIGGPDYLVCLLASGFPAVLVEKFDLGAVVDAYRRHRVTMAGGSTVFYTMFLGVQRQQPDEPIIPTLRLLSGGGAPKPPEIFFEVQAEMGIPVAHGYGMTESPMICQGSPADSDDQLAHTEGHPVHAAQVAICRPDGSECDRGEEGEVRISGPQLFKGYRDPSLNADAFDDLGRFRSGDLAVMRDDGHVTLTGRLKDVIIRKGENIAAKEIEDVLYTHPAVGAVAVIGLPDTERGERVCAVVETAEDSEPLTLDQMAEASADAGLMRQKVPEQLVVYDGPLPPNATMKILKYELKEALAEIPLVRTSGSSWWRCGYGLKLTKVASPIGVIVIIYESRPNVTADAAGLCFKSGNATILRGGKEAVHSNKIIAKIMVQAAAGALPSFPANAIQVVPTTDRGAITELLSLTRFVDLCIPRGGESLIRAVTECSHVPVIKHYKGVCHVYIDADADAAMAEEIVLNSKAHRPGVCNAAETLLVEKSVAANVLPRLGKRLAEANVELRGDKPTHALLDGSGIKLTPASADDWDEEYLDLVLSVKIVDGIGEAIEHISAHGSGHTETIVTGDPAAAKRFQTEVDSSTIFWNASTRFSDGMEFGMGAEIGISTDKIGARGPMGLEELTSYKWLGVADGLIRK